MGALVGFILPFQSEPVTRALIAWNAGIWTYLLLMAWLMSRAHHALVCGNRQTGGPQVESSSLLLMSICSFI